MSLSIHLISRSIPDLQHILTCTLSTCHESDSWYGYRPSLVPNAVLLAFSVLSLIGYVLEGIFRPDLKGITIVMAIGAFGEALGYLGRSLSHLDPFSKIPYIIQSVCLTISPIFLAAGLYLIFPEVTRSLDIPYSRCRISIPRAFISCDILAFLLLSAGAGLLASPRPTITTTKVGFYVLSAGVVFQALTLASFIAVSADAACQNWPRIAVIWAMRDVDRFRGLTDRRVKYGTRGILIALPVSALVILIERIYYAVEIISGHGRLIGPETLNVFLDGVMICLAMLLQNVFHPGICFQTRARISVKREVMGTL